MSPIRGTATIIAFALLGPGVVFVGCASLGKAVDATEGAANKAASATATTASKAYQRMQRYLAEKDVLQTFHDAGEHSETAVLAVLHKSAVGGHGAGTSATSAAAGAGGAATAGAAAAASPGASKTHKPSTAAPPLPVPEQYGGSYRWPLDAGIISSEYGDRWGKMHKGLDLAADAGEPVYAVAPGEVIYAGDGLRGYGNVVILRHDRRYSSLYAHNSELKVKQGDHVGQGALIALLGNTGHSTGPHVHFEIRDGDDAINPHTMLPKSKLAYAVCAGAACETERTPEVWASRAGASLEDARGEGAQRANGE